MRQWLKNKLREHQLRSLDPLAQTIRDQKLTYLSRDKLLSLQNCRDEVVDVPGDFAEMGVALGGSSILLANWALGSGRRFSGYDVFSMIPPPGELDGAKSHERYEVIASGDSHGIDGQGEYYGYMENLRDVVIEHFRTHGMEVDGDAVCLHEGFFQDTLHPSAPVALAHIDCDWHDPVALCIERLRPHLSPGALLIFDDYNDYEGCRLAVDQALRDHPELTLVDHEPHAILRVG